jgi:hypothetical protein
VTKKGQGWEHLRRRSSALRRSLESLAAEFAALSSKDQVDAIRGTGVLEGEVRAWQTVLAGLSTKATDALRRLRNRRDEQVETFDQRLLRELRARALTVHGETALLIVEGIVHVEANSKVAMVKINGSPVEELSSPMIATRVTAEVERLRGLITPPADMLRQLLAAYERETAATGQPPGSQVRSTAILAQLAFLRQRPAFTQNPVAANYREYPRDVFRAELFTLLADGNQLIQGKRFRYASGSDPGGAVFMLVPALGRAAHVGRLWFEAAA